MPAELTPFHWFVVTLATRHTSRIGAAPAPLVRMMLGSIRTGTP